MALRDADTVQTAPVTALGLIGGYITARESGIRPLGGVVLGGAGLLAGRSWLSRTDAPTTALLSAIYIGGFGASHPLAKKVGAWPAVLGAAGLSAAASYLLSDRR